MLSKPSYYSSDVFYMFLEGLAEDYYIIAVGNANVIADPFQAILHKTLELCGGVLEAEGHPDPFIKTPWGDKCSVLLVFWVYETLMIGFALIKERKPSVFP